MRPVAIVGVHDHTKGSGERPGFIYLACRNVQVARTALAHVEGGETFHLEDLLEKLERGRADDPSSSAL